MKITEVKVTKVERDDIVRGFATVKIDDCFVVNNIRILEGESGLSIAMPSKKGADGKYHDMAHPINQETRTMFEEAILNKYNETE